ncbi:MAG: CPBP family intramembrane glutamic endopeptidase [Phycisphaerales bacterium]
MSEATAGLMEGAVGGVRRRVRWWRWVEMLVLFGVVPVVLDLRWFGLALIPMLVVLGCAAVGVLLLDRSFENRRLWRVEGLGRELPRILLWWVVGAAAMTGFLLWYAPERMFGFVRSDPGQWAFVMLAYPAFSAFMQGVVFRCLFFHRYGELFPRAWMLIGASAVAFGWAHIVLENWIAVAFCTVGGVLFGITYYRTRSNLAATLEQALYGDFIWTIGLGWWFYSGRLG